MADPLFSFLGVLELSIIIYRYRYQAREGGIGSKSERSPSGGRGRRRLPEIDASSAIGVIYSGFGSRSEHIVKEGCVGSESERSGRRFRRVLPEIDAVGLEG